VSVARQAAARPIPAERQPGERAPPLVATSAVERGCSTPLVLGGFTCFASPVAKELGFRSRTSPIGLDKSPYSELPDGSRGPPDWSPERNKSGDTLLGTGPRPRTGVAARRTRGPSAGRRQDLPDALFKGQPGFR